MTLLPATVFAVILGYFIQVDAQASVFKKCIPELEFETEFALAPVQYVIESQLRDALYEKNGTIIKHYGSAGITSFRYLIPGDCKKITLKAIIKMEVFITSTRSDSCKELVLDHEMEHIRHFKTVFELTKKHWLKVWNYTRDFGRLQNATKHVETSIGKAMAEINLNNDEFDLTETRNYQLHSECQK